MENENFINMSHTYEADNNNDDDIDDLDDDDVENATTI